MPLLCSTYENWSSGYLSVYYGVDSEALGHICIYSDDLAEYQVHSGLQLTLYFALLEQ